MFVIRIKQRKTYQGDAVSVSRQVKLCYQTFQLGIPFTIFVQPEAFRRYGVQPTDVACGGFKSSETSINIIENLTSVNERQHI